MTFRSSSERQAAFKKDCKRALPEEKGKSTNDHLPLFKTNSDIPPTTEKQSGIELLDKQYEHGIELLDGLPKIYGNRMGR